MRGVSSSDHSIVLARLGAGLKPSTKLSGLDVTIELARTIVVNEVGAFGTKEETDVIAIPLVDECAVDDRCFWEVWKNPSP